MMKTHLSLNKTTTQAIGVTNKKSKKNQIRSPLVAAEVNSYNENYNCEM